MTTKKFVTAEYHEGQHAFERRQAKTTNPYLRSENAGQLWYWSWGWDDALAEKLWSIEDTIMYAAQSIDKKDVH
jgi:hypothetical protein|tara:strand:- start:964 stop:1185 length:222 start_codon:yes stop_codon:yes gene_type:complete